MAQNQAQQEIPAPSGKKVRRRSRAWLWILLTVVLLLALATAAVFGLRSQNALRVQMQALQAENQAQGETLRALSAENRDRESRLSRLRSDQADKDARIQSLIADNADKDARIQSLITDNADKDARIQSMTAQLAAAEADPAPSSPDQSSPDQPENPPQPDEWGYVDEDGDGLILVPIRGKFTGYMLIVLDPSRVVLGCEPQSLGIRGGTVQYFVEKEDAVAGINGGGFVDANGMGNGATPDTLIVSRGEIHCGSHGVGRGFVGIDDNYRLHVGVDSPDAVKNLHIQEGCGYGPVLIKDGQMAPADRLVSGLNPRTAIGQRSDGAILMLVTEGRQPSRLGCSYQDEADLMQRFGAVNACNLDGGASSLLWYDGEYINNRAYAVVIRPVPTSFLVLKEGRQGNG